MNSVKKVKIQMMK